MTQFICHGTETSLCVAPWVRLFSHWLISKCRNYFHWLFNKWINSFYWLIRKCRNSFRVRGNLLGHALSPTINFVFIFILAPKAYKWAWCWLFYVFDCIYVYTLLKIIITNTHYKYLCVYIIQHEYISCLFVMCWLRTPCISISMLTLHPDAREGGKKSKEQDHSEGRGWLIPRYCRGEWSRFPMCVFFYLLELNKEISSNIEYKNLYWINVFQ